MFSKKIAAMIIAVVIMIISPLCTANAGSATAMLRTNMTSATTGWLGNITGRYRLVGSVSSASEYSVQYCVVKAASESSKEVPVKTFSYSSMDPFEETFEVGKEFTVVKCTLYGNLKDNPKPGCYANGILSNN